MASKTLRDIYILSREKNLLYTGSRRDESSRNDLKTSFLDTVTNSPNKNVTKTR